MKKLIILTCILAMLLTMTFAVAAEEAPLVLTDASTAEGQTVYLTLKLNASISGDTMGITYAYDAELLEPMLSSCSWLQKGSLSNFNRENAGVWAAGKVQELSGDICVLAFRVKSGVSFQKTSVTCTLIVKNGTQEVASYTAESTISYACTHNYGDWTGGKEIGHYKTCSNCSATLTELHSWSEGVPTANPDDPNHDLLVFTCGVCGDVRNVEIPKIQDEPSNTPTHYTQPTEETEPYVPDELLTVPPEPFEDPTVPELTVPKPPEPTKPTDPSLPSENITPLPDPTDFIPQETLPHDPDIPTQPTSPEVLPGTETPEPVDPEETGATESPEPTDPSKPTDPSDPSKPSDPQDKPTPTEPKKPQEEDTEKPAPQPTYPDNGSQEQAPDDKEMTEATYFPTVPATEPTTPYQDYNPTPTGTVPFVTEPAETEAAAEVCTDPAHDHEHEHSQQTGNPAVTAAVVIGFLAAALIGAMLFLKKKRK